MNRIVRIIKNVLHYDQLTESRLKRRKTLEVLEEKLSLLETELSDSKRLLKDALYNTEEERSYLSSEYVRKKRSNNKTRVLICGYYGAQNGGDELMLRAMLDNIGINEVDISILLSHNYALDSSIYFPYRTIHYPKKPDDCRFIAEEFDIIIWGGGAVLDDSEYYYRGADNNLTYIEMTISKMALQLNKKVLVFGVSANMKLTDKRMIKDLQYVIDSSQFFSLRDKNSLNSLRDSGIRRLSKINIIDDLALANTYLTTKKQKQKSNMLRLGFIFILKDNIGYLSNFVKEVVNLFPEETMIQVNLISFFNQYRHDAEMLEQLSGQISGFQNVKISIIDEDLTVEGIARALQCSDYLFSMRYHATLIAGFVLGQNVISINYGDTHRHYYNKIKYIKDNYIHNLREINYGSLYDERTIKRVGGYLTEQRFYRIDKRRIEKIRSELGKRISDEVSKQLLES